MSAPRWGTMIGQTDTLAVAFIETPPRRWGQRVGRECLTGELLTYQRASGEIIEVPVGFRCDGASIPRLAWWLAGHPFDRCLRAALIHDWLCYEPNRARHQPGTVHRVMYEVMRWQVERRQLARWRCEIIYLAVRLFGPRWNPRGGRR